MHELEEGVALSPAVVHGDALEVSVSIRVERGVAEARSVGASPSVDGYQAYGASVLVDQSPAQYRVGLRQHEVRRACLPVERERWKRALDGTVAMARVPELHVECVLQWDVEEGCSSTMDWFGVSLRGAEVEFPIAVP